MRAESQLPPIDTWNLGIEYTYRRIFKSFAFLTVLEEDLW